MGRNNKSRKNNNKEKKDKNADFKNLKPKWHEDLRHETKHSILAVVAFASSFIFILITFHKAGVTGDFIFKIFSMVFGAGFYLLPVLSFLLGVSFLISFRTRILAVNFIGGAMFLAGSLGIIESVFKNKNGGYFGYLISYPLLQFFDIWAALIMLFAILVVSILMIFNISLRFNFKKKEDKFAPQDDLEKQKITAFNFNENTAEINGQEMDKKNGIPAKTEKETRKEEEEKEFAAAEKGLGILRGLNREKRNSGLPPIHLLQGDKGKPSFGDIKANSNIIKRTLQNFGIEVEMGEVSIGPSVTQFTLKPAQGVKLAKIVALANDLSLALATHPLRIEAPIPGKSLVGIEVPNKSTALVGLRSLIESIDFQNNPAPLLIALGRNVAGHSVYADLTKMPHLLIAGSTGSGKSVSIHALIASLLYKNTSKNLRFLMVDPKRVELNAYSNIPHLLCPAITEAKKTILALRWAVKEMERRYELLFNKKVRDINSYRELILKNGEEHDMPYIIVVIDELADIMAVYPRELEASIVRLAQMSRAVGIHLIVSTQRPSVEVITGLIKANITSRIAFQVASQIDSRTILDMSGAEKLLGNGDMLFLSGDSSKPKRIQGAFVSEDEVKRVTDYLENEYPPELAAVDIDLTENMSEKEARPVLNFDEFGDEENEGDDLYIEAKDLIIEAQKASASYLQRRLKIGYARAARLLDIMEKNGVVGPADHAKPREVYVQKEN